MVVVTGASSGIGRCFVKRMFQANQDLLIFNLSRSDPEPIEGGPSVRHRSTDLSDSGQVDQAASWLEDSLQKVGPGKLLLINNSGFGSYGHFPAPGLDHQMSMLAVNVCAPVQLTGRLLPHLRERGGAIINVASTAAFQPTAYMATYGASKAFVLNWSLALQQELKHTQVRVLALCPGPTESRFFERAGFGEPPLGGLSGKSTGESVADVALNALAKGKTIVTPGLQNKVAAALVGVLPKRMQAPVAELVLRKLRLEKHLRQQ